MDASSSGSTGGNRPTEAPQVSRKYQQEMIDHAVAENVICSLDTGSGKTHIATQLIHRLYDAHRKAGRSQRSFVVMFLADRVPLVIQQAKYVISHRASHSSAQHLRTSL
jgi:ERCC4-related helicase